MGLQSVTEGILKNLRILIVDDNASNVRLLERYLQIFQYKNIKTVTDSRDVLSVYQSYEPDLLLLDLYMPYYDGFEVMKLLREQIADFDYVPILVLTAQDDQDNLLRAFQMGARDFIGKPFNQSELMMRIRNLLEVRYLYHELRKQNEMLETKVVKRTEQLKSVQMELVERLGQAVEFRDQDTGFHISRMSQYSAILGKAAGLDEQMVELLLHSSTLHDIGKIAIPDSILMKPGKLTVEEFEQMKAHTTIGANMLQGSSSKLIQMAYEIALSHHEKWDGTGYPLGLKGEEIPLVGRIVAICDVFDALTSERPYKQAWDAEEAVDFICKSSGTHFDPQLVQLFQQVLPSILAIKNKYHVQ